MRLLPIHLFFFNRPQNEKAGKIVIEHIVEQNAKKQVSTHYERAGYIHAVTAHHYMDH